MIESRYELKDTITDIATKVLRSSELQKGEAKKIVLCFTNLLYGLVQYRKIAKKNFKHRKNRRESAPLMQFLLFYI